MSRQDPIPPGLERGARAWARYKALMSWLILGVALALLFLELSGSVIAPDLVIAVIAGLFLTVLLGTGLIGLAYFNSHAGHDDSAHIRESNHDLR